ncbi:MAG: ABC transporter ATP-binding protein [Christensenellales bacterium]
MPAVLSVESVCFKNIIDYPDLAIEEGKATFLTGESGSGKSTLLRLFNGTVSPSAGTVFYRGKNVAQLDTVALRREVLLAGQSVFLFDRTIRENFKEFYGYRGLSAPGDEEIETCLSLCLANFPLDTVCTTMSGGERHRVYIAICLSLMPKVLMLDEPTAALDAQNAAALLRSVTSFCRSHGMTLLVVSHDAALSREFADNVIVLDRRDN